MSEPILCPRCGNEMNHHALMIREPIEHSDEEESEVIEVHACPGCGMTESRPGVESEP